MTRFFKLLILVFSCLFVTSLSLAEDNDYYTIGVSAPLSGSLQHFGEWTVRGIELAVEELNAKGGINGRKFRIIAEDDKCLPASAITAVKRLQDIKKINMFIVFCTSVAAPVGEVTQGKSVVLTPSYKTEALYRPEFSHYFSMQPTIQAEMKVLAKYVQSEGIKRVAIILEQNDFFDTYGTFFAEELKKREIDLVFDERVQIGDNDFKTHLTKIRAKKADAIFFGFKPDQAAALLKQYEAYKINAKLLSNWAAQSPSFLSLPSEYTQGIVYTYSYDQDYSSISKSFDEKFQENFGQHSQATSACTYDAVYTYARALKKCGNDDVKCIKDTIPELSAMDGASGIFKFVDRSTNKRAILKTIRDNEFQKLKQ